MAKGELRTYNGKHTIAEWWKLAEQAQKARSKISLFQDLIQRDDLVFDIGANRGMMTMVFRWLGAKIVAVEPLAAIAPQCVRELGWKFANDPNVRIVEKAVAPTPKVDIWVHNNLPYLSSGDQNWRKKSAHKVFYADKNSTKKTVEAVTLDQLIGEFGQPTFIKIDVEGAENQVVKTLTHPVDALSLEFHQDWIPLEGLDHLLALDTYVFNWARNFGGEWVLSEWVGKTQLLDSFEKQLDESGPKSWGDLYAKRTG
jgi:FkbM family methyltransferase